MKYNREILFADLTASTCHGKLSEISEHVIIPRETSQAKLLTCYMALLKYSTFPPRATRKPFNKLFIQVKELS